MAIRKKASTAERAEAETKTTTTARKTAAKKAARRPVERAEPLPDASAIQRGTRQSPYKMRLVIDQIRGKNVNEALMTLKFTNKPKSTREIEKVVKSAVANATQKDENLDVDTLFVETCFINEGPRLKRIRPAPMGRAYRYQRRTSHITIELGERK